MRCKPRALPFYQSGGRPYRGPFGFPFQLLSDEAFTDLHVITGALTGDKALTCALYHSEITVVHPPPIQD